MINFLQISDPHFGNPFSNTRESIVNSGLNIHDFRLCEALHQFFNEDVADMDELSDQDDLFVVMNGDLTSKGDTQQFETAKTFLFSQHPIDRDGHTQHVGLQISRQSDEGKDLYAGIPGNHDHANGSWRYPFVRGYCEDMYHHFESKPPFIKQTWCSDGLELCIFGIDSCSMYEETTINWAPMASGGFSQRHREAFKDFLAEELRKPLIDGCSLRTCAILCHHPLTADGSAGPLCPFCVRWLQLLAADHGIRMVLTGHTHRTSTQRFEIDHMDGTKRTLREVRCPTTLQTPAMLNTAYQSPGLWWHQLRVEDSMIVWNGTLLLYSGSSFVVPRRGVHVEGSHSKPIREVWFQESMPSISLNLT